MGFQLVIAEGKEAGREFIFEQDSVLIGRTSDCDVVLYDPGVSRKHARIFSEANGYFVEDMGSSNGTKVNGAIIKKKQLADGDAISLGPVVFNFSGLASIDESTDAQVEQQVGSTRIVSANDVAKRTKGKGAALAPEGAGENELQELSRSSTRTIQAVRETQAQSRKSLVGVKPLSARNGQSSGSLQAQPSRQRGSNPNGVAERAQLSAAERARIRRQSAGPSAAFRIMWAEASKAKRIAIASGASVATAGLLFVAFHFAFPVDDSIKPPPPEPGALQPSQPVEQSFGYGEGVTYERIDQKVFDFEFKSPVKTVVVLHYQAKDISQNEVEISVNGQSVGFVPPDTLAVNERSNEALVPPSALVRNGNNKIVFDNTKNPPGKDTWRIWNVWVEVFPLPEGTRDELLKLAQENLRRGQEFWERRTIGAENLYKAWRSFRDCWLTLESVDGSKPMEYIVSRDKMRESQQELDKTCSKLLLEATTGLNQHRYDEARMTLEHVNEYFPKKDQPCPFRAEQLRDYYNL
jgi:pSer/pThr/pTyr-binding forkhead associated (FHA) protein